MSHSYKHIVILYCITNYNYKKAYKYVNIIILVSKNIDNINNIWELYGVRENPFSTSPLLVMGGTLPIDSFVGRKESIQRLLKIIGAKGGSRNLVFGDVGVGKTSFVNVVRHKAMMAGYFTPFKEIAVLENWSLEDFILNTLAGIYSTLKLMKDSERPIKKELFDKLETLLEIGKSNVNAGISVAGFGANYGSEKRQAGELTSVILQDLFNEIISEIMTNRNNEIIIHYNNLELLSEKKIRYLFNNLRDFFQTRGIHFIFVGNLTVHSNLQSIPRFSSILTDTPFHIEPLKFEEVEEIIRNRFIALRISKSINIIQPYTRDCLRTLFDLMDGNIRNILNSLSTAVSEITGERPVMLDSRMLSVTLKDVLEKRYLCNLQPRARQVLLEIVKHTEITNKALSDNLKLPRSNVSSYVKDLMHEGCVYLRRKNGKDKYWSAEPKIKWALLKESNSPQRLLPSF